MNRTLSRRYRVRVIVALAPVVALLPIVGTGCDSDEPDPSGTSIPGVPANPGGDDSTTSSLPGPQYTAAPNPDAGGGGAPTSAP
jgi:hypothetical protein